MLKAEVTGRRRVRKIEARNVDNGSVYEAGSSTIGNYVLPQLPTGNYQLTVTVTGFAFSRTAIPSAAWKPFEPASLSPRRHGGIYPLDARIPSG